MPSPSCRAFALAFSVLQRRIALFSDTSRIIRFVLCPPARVRSRRWPKVAEGAIAALKLAHLPTEGLHPKDVSAVMNEPIDLVVTVCNNAKETRPIFQRPVPRIHLPFHDPHSEPLERFVRLRDEIRTRLVPAVRQALVV